jgi:hypothetical protein
MIININIKIMDELRSNKLIMNNNLLFENDKINDEALEYANNLASTHTILCYNIGTEKNRNMNNENFNTSKSSLLDVVNFLAFSKKEFNNFIKNSDAFDLSKYTDSKNLLNYSFTITKIQKILIISLLKYYVVLFFEKNIELTENNVVKYCPIDNFNEIIVKKCGFGIKNDSSIKSIDFPRDYFYDELFHSDHEESLFYYLRKPELKLNVVDAVLNLSYFSKSRMSSSIDNLFKKCIVNTYFNFALYKSTDIGEKILNPIKDKNTKEGTLISIYDLIKLVDDKKNAVNNILIDFLYNK